ncbi:hypothetical protein WR25_00775 isoform H [Diploscapter pachys]|nr:hypothetical protein WR25_00775 isoform B [Diploscapter pachys]PAV73577.1 hypothetical protein WR25_00775 isoform C [Diploscapter pachys]PAV73582.1 hypothetical protein WR25_00775 isoform H [Diploscapter pachys]
MCTASGPNSSCSKFEFILKDETIKFNGILAASAVQTSVEGKIMLRIVIMGDDNQPHGAIYRYKAQDEGILQPLDVSHESDFFDNHMSVLGFERNNFTFFVGSTYQPNEPYSLVKRKVGSNSTLPKITRVCSRDETFELYSRISITLDCGGDNVLALQSASYQESTDTLHVVVKTPDHFEVCTYSMTTVNEKFEATWNICQDTDYHAADDCKFERNTTVWDAKNMLNCWIYTHATNSHPTPCSKYGGSESLRYDNCQLSAYGAGSYNFGWLENYKKIPGTVEAIFPTVFDIAMNLIPTPEAYFLSGLDKQENRVIRISRSAASRPANIVWQVLTQPQSDFAITQSSDKAVLLSNGSQIVLAKITCHDLYPSCHNLADGGFNDPMGCAWCAKSGDERSIEQNKKDCFPSVKGKCPPNLKQTIINHNSTQLNIWGQNLTNLQKPYISLCNDICRVTHHDFNHLECKMEADTKIDRGCQNISLMGQLGDNMQFPIEIRLDSIKSEESVATGDDSETGKKSNTKLYRVIGATIAVLVVILLIAGFLWFIRDKLKAVLQYRRTKQTSSYNTSTEGSANLNRFNGFNMTRIDDPSRDHDLYESTYYSMIPQEYQIPYDELELGRQLGKGYYGDVHLGTYNRRYDPIQVACKMIRPEGRARDFFNEAKIMTKFDSDRVLKLIGVAYKHSYSPIVVTEYMHNGDLVNYLRDESNRPTLRLLLKFATQIAEGMEHIQSRNYIHRDLAARNCMLDKNLDVKVADFGLCRPVDPETMEYEATGRDTSMPVRWMAIESLTDEAYNKKSDVWAYGVLTWELMTRGSLPYGSQKDVHEIKNLLKNRYRLPIPEYCPPSLYQRVMIACWHANPQDRPSFTQIQYVIKEITDDLERSQNSNLYTHYERVSSTTNGNAMERCTIPETSASNINGGYSIANGRESF